ncbi:MAG: sensor histidine kinase [Haloferacaceae archaeon]
MAETLSHDLGNALTTLEGYVALARKSADADERFADVEATVERLHDLVDELTATVRAGDPIGDVESVALESIARAACRTSPLAAEGLRVESDAVVEADPRALRRLLENLFDNAVKHAGPDPTVTVGDLDDGFYVEDDGGGFPDRVAADPFAVGVTTDDESDGLGLASVAQIADGHGWTVEATEGEDGARFEIGGVDRVRRGLTSVD